uniref:NADH-ubiquinone oxidoreductase chain 5 n=1 Tax=Macromedaeus distinguendus TaxID=331416 RepID=A0A891GWF9_9EUCA|nr:NADH dehydrogenase subunit 5 [Macromedaeus distinguendus]QRK27339.1 NADH dehydrogenase subunit 5 [Macromedaeus distinguendus]
MWKFLMHEVSMLSLGLGSVCCVSSAVFKLNKGVMDVIEWELMNLNSSSIIFTLVLDWISLLFLGFVFLISSSVLYYSGSYMMGDKSFNRFMYLVLAFVASMMFMVMSPNLISILLGWDGLGLVSYALVIYYQNEKSANAGMLTVLSNRVGDVAILMSIGLMSTLGGWNFFIYGGYMEGWNFFKWFVVLAAMTKSAQIPFSAWLPAAMAAPTPVSALVHSSTLVTAGVYLMIRFSSALEGTKVQSGLLIISCLTMFMAGLGANFEYDLKKIIALSTLSQLGVMLSILALGFPDLAFFHLLSHALFKALLFMCAGVIIHSVSDYQDIRFMGSLVSFMPLSVSYMTIANLALCGFPFLAGFYSKDLILEVAFMSWVNFIALILFILATSLTVMYTARLIYYSLSGDFNLSSSNNVNDEDSVMVNSMSMLGLGAILGGAFLSWLVFPDPSMICLSGFMKMLVMNISIMGALIGYMFNMTSSVYKLMSLNNYKFIVLAGSMWFMPYLSSLKTSEISLITGGMLQKMGDKGWYEHFGGQGGFYFFSKLFMVLNKFQMNSVKVFMKMFLIMIIVIMFVII